MTMFNEENHGKLRETSTLEGNFVHWMDFVWRFRCDPRLYGIISCLPTACMAEIYYLSTSFSPLY